MLTRAARGGLLAVGLAALAPACGTTPDTSVVLDNEYAPSSGLVVYRAFWQAVAFQVPVPPGGSSDPQPTVPATDNLAYVIAAKGWDPDASTAPTDLVLLESRVGFTVHLDDTLHIPVNDDLFVGNCDAGSHLTAEQARFFVNQVYNQTIFPDAAAPIAHYDPATCTATFSP